MMAEGTSNPLRTIDAAGLAVCVALTVGAYFVAVQPMLDRRSEIDTQRAQVDAERQAAALTAAKLAELRQHAARVEQAVASNPLRLQPMTQLNTWLAMIADLATKTGVQLDQLEPGAPVRAEHYVTVPIRLSGRGDYAASTRFLHQLHEAMPDTAVESMELAGHPRTPDQPATFRFSLLWHASPAEPLAEVTR
jgi:Tfp pilus assembly protein PilO